MLVDRASRICFASVLALPSYLALTGRASAHHAMDGTTPATLVQGLMSGLAHPVIGLDHLAFVVGIGLLAAVRGFGPALPAAFVLMMLAGIGLHLAAFDLPATEMLVALSVVAVGLVLVRGPSRRLGLEGGVFALAGAIHGYALGESIIGAEATPLAAYLAGLAVIQLAISLGAYALARGLLGGWTLPQPALRMCGLAIAATGLVFAVMASGVLA